MAVPLPTAFVAGIACVHLPCFTLSKHFALAKVLIISLYIWFPRRVSSSLVSSSLV